MAYRRRRTTNDSRLLEILELPGIRPFAAYLRRSLARRLLGIAEKLPRFRAGRIAELQRIRERQREGARRHTELTRLPQGVTLELTTLLAVEIYSLEELEDVEHGLTRLFGRQRTIHNWRDAITLGTHQPRTRVRAPIGTIARTLPHFPVDHVAIMPTLPPEFVSISIGFSKLATGLFSLAFTAKLSPLVSEQLRKIHSSHYLGEVEFRWLLPVGRAGMTRSEGAPSSEHNAIRRAWEDSLSLKLERVVRKYFPGHFSRATPRESRSRLPRLTVLEMKGTGPPLCTEEGRQPEVGWLGALGFSPYEPRVYGAGPLLLSWDIWFGREPENPVIAVFETVESAREREQLARDRFDPLAVVLTAAEDAIALRGFVSAADRSVDRLSSEVLRLRRRKLNRRAVASLVRAAETTWKELILVQRLRRDWEESTDFWLEGIRPFSRLRVCDGNPEHQDSADAGAALQALARASMQRLERDLREAIESYTSALNLASVGGMYILQRRIFWLTALVAVATLVLLWPELAKLVDQVDTWIDFGSVAGN